MVTNSMARLRRTKIVATIGPASRAPAMLRALMDAGVDVARLNLAHSDAPTHARDAAQVRRAADEAGRIIGLLADLPGPKMRTGEVQDGEVLLQEGQTFRLTSTPVLGDETVVSVTIDNLEDLVSSGDEIFLADGQIVLAVRDVDPNTIDTVVVRGGTLRSGKGMHVTKPDARIAGFEQAEAAALKVALDLEADLIGLSFVRTAEDVRRVRSLLAGDARTPLLVAKIETRAAVANLKAIVDEADAVMVARGDLGIELPLQQVPVLQKQAIHTCNIAGKPVITATQMLESMTRVPLPTRAEVTDVANAVFDGTDALMLSEETAIGEFPVESVRAMNDIALEAEQNVAFEPRAATSNDDEPVSWAIARAAVQTAEEVSAAVIVCPTRTGSTARRVAAFRPTMPILALDDNLENLRPLALLRGVIPLLVPFVPEQDLPARGLKRALAAVDQAAMARPGDLIALVGRGSPPTSSSTDFVRILAV